MSSVAPFKGLVEFSSGFSLRPQISHVVFDFDGTLSWLRHGWAEISDEEQNGSGRMHPQKRKLLVAAGADAVIPDYRDATALIETILNK
jgi:phosphoglycolate phosphatase-like HAD superfamily hydrolase